MMRVRWGKILLGFLVVWILILIYLLAPIWFSRGELEDELAKKLKTANEEIQRLSEETDELRASLEKMQRTCSESMPPAAVAVPPAADPPISQASKSDAGRAASKEYEMTS